MSNDCKVCTHRNRLFIDRAIAEGGNLAQVAKKYDVPYHSIYQHSQNHISRQLAKVMEKRVMIESNELMETITKIIKSAEVIFERNFKEKKDLLALKALDSQRNTIQLLSNISAQIHAAKMAELQLEKEKHGDTKEQDALEYATKLQILTFAELKVYQRLQNKIINQSNDKVIGNNRVIE